MTLTTKDIEDIRTMILSATISSAGDQSRDINRVSEVKEVPPSQAPDMIGGEGEILEGKGKGSGIGGILQTARGTTSPTALLGRVAAFTGPTAIAFVVLPMIESTVKQMIEELQRPGGILDKRVKIDSRNEAFAELDRQTRQNTRIGDRQVIIQQFEGFRNFEGHASTNTSRMINENANRVLDIGLFDRAQGV